MSLISTALRDQRVMLGSLAAMATGTVLLVYTLLRQYQADAEIQPDEPKTQYITQETEDALKYSTLETLLGHYNYSIRDTAAKIVCDRAASDEALSARYDVLLYGITRPDYDERIKNLRAMAVITDQHTLYQLHNWKAASALVRSLELCVEPRENQVKLDDKHWDDYFLRDMAEKLCLMFTSSLLSRYSARKLLAAGIVEKWLARQYWGDNPDEIIHNFQQYMFYRSNRITDLIGCLVHLKSGRKRLYEAGLISKHSKRIMDNGYNCPATGEEAEEAEGGAHGSDEDQTDRPVGGRPQEQSIEEQRLRHRNREAMVFNDGTRPLNSGDIIQRDQGSW